MLFRRPSSVNHAPVEDLLALFAGTALCALGLTLLQAAGLITGQTAGLAVLLAYVTDWSFGAIFFVINIPFYLLALSRFGIGFTARTFAAVLLVSALADAVGHLVVLETIHPGAAAALGGVTTGMGLLVVIRHGASLGGIGVVALWLQERGTIQAGWTQLLFDVALFAAAFLVLPPSLVLWSLLGTVVVNVILALNHRRDRYVAR